LLRPGTRQARLANQCAHMARCARGGIGSEVGFLAAHGSYMSPYRHKGSDTSLLRLRPVPVNRSSRAPVSGASPAAELQPRAPTRNGVVTRCRAIAVEGCAQFPPALAPVDRRMTVLRRHTNSLLSQRVVRHLIVLPSVSNCCCQPLVSRRAILPPRHASSPTGVVGEDARM
jgi:hypothetical protein